MPVHAAPTQCAKCADAADELDQRRVADFFVIRAGGVEALGQPSTEPCVSIAAVLNLDRAINLDTDVICVFLGKDT